MNELTRSQYSLPPLGGLGSASRSQLAKILRASSGTITPEAAALALKEPQLKTSKLLARWAAQGWLQRVRRGLYVPIPLESERTDSAPEDPWLIAQAAFSPCFISGWSAAEHWSLTDQMFRSVCVATTCKPRPRKQIIGGTTFVLRTVNKAHLFGLKTVWRGRAREQISDPSRTIVDLLADPTLGGGLRSSVDMFEDYLKAKEHRDLKKLIDYAQQLGNGAVFKRMGFLLQRLAPDETDSISACAKNLSTGYAKLDASLPAKRLVTAWNLWVPTGW